MGDTNGILQIFLSVSARPWRECELKGSITAVKIGSLFNSNEVSRARLLPSIINHNFFIDLSFAIKE
jgi:hypothetical protein